MVLDCMKLAILSTGGASKLRSCSSDDVLANILPIRLWLDLLLEEAPMTACLSAHSRRLPRLSRTAPSA